VTARDTEHPQGVLRALLAFPIASPALAADNLPALPSLITKADTGPPAA
jgi:hypothetical protein